MKTRALISVCLALLAISSCKMKKDNESNEFISEICNLKPGNWTCKIIDNNFDSIPLLKRLDKPEIVLEFLDSKTGSSPVFLFVYDISKQVDLEKVIRESMIEANCVPVFFGENKNYYVVTSSCYVNSNFFSQNSNLKPAAAKLFTKYNESIIR